MSVDEKGNKTYETLGSVIPVKFVIAASTDRPAQVTFDPASPNSDVLRSTAQTVVANGTEGNTVYAKFSSTGTNYTLEGLVNESNVYSAITSVGVFSTEVAARKITGAQIYAKSDNELYISDNSLGTPIDGVGQFNIRSSNDALDENSDFVSHTNTVETENDSQTAKTVQSKTTHERTFKVPARGAYVRFEPERDGQLTIWALQQGGVHFNEDVRLCDKFVRRRPVYFVDEQGKSLVAVSAESSARLSNNWSNIIKNYDNNGGKAGFTPLNGYQNGVVNSLYTQDESEAIYNMYMNYFSTNHIEVGDPIAPFAIHTSANGTITEKDGQSPDSNYDMTGYVLASGGYVKYVFNVQAGKTYYFFGHRTKIGVRGFQFVASNPDDSKTLTITETETSNTTAISNALNNGTYKTTGFDRTFAANTWTTLVLPFSMSATQVEQTFGEGTDIMHFDHIDGTKLHFYGHRHRMIVAGTPVFIKPTQKCNLNDLYVQVENTTPEVMTSSGYDFQGYYNYGANVHQYDYYLSTSGNLSQKTTTGSANLKSTRALLHSNGSSAKLELLFKSIDDDETTGIEVVYDDVTGDVTVVKNANVYNTRGQLVRRNANSLEGLPKGVYIVNGMKYVVK